MLSRSVHAPVPELILKALPGEQLEEVRHWKEQTLRITLKKKMEWETSFPP